MFPHPSCTCSLVPTVAPEVSPFARLTSMCVSSTPSRCVAPIVARLSVLCSLPWHKCILLIRRLCVRFCSGLLVARQACQHQKEPQYQEDGDRVQPSNPPVRRREAGCELTRTNACGALYSLDRDSRQGCSPSKVGRATPAPTPSGRPAAVTAVAASAEPCRRRSVQGAHVRCHRWVLCIGSAPFQTEPRPSLF